MAKHSVNVIVKAKDMASKKFAVIGASAKLMGAAFKSAAKIARNTLAVAFRTIKRAAIGLAAAFAYCTYAALKQEAAEIELASALKMAGKYSEDTMRKLKAQAAAIQDVTTYGDEYVLSLMRIAMTLGVTADKSADAAKAAIALHAGYGGGRGKPEVFLRYYIDALQGTGSSLASYVVEMKKAKTEQGKLVILQGAVNKSWGVAKSKADSATGALKQMKNKLGDVAEAIARPFLPAIQSSAKAITNWAARNEAQIAWWAKKTYSWITFIKDVFLDFAKFMREDWRAALGFAFGSFLKLLKATFHSAVILAIAGGKGIWAGIREGLLGGKESRILERMELQYKKGAGGPFPITPGGEVLWKRWHPLYKELRKEAEKKELQKQAKSILGETLNAVTKEFGNAFKGILADMPADLRGKTEKSFAILQKRLEALGGKPAGAAGGAPGGVGAPIVDALKNVLDRMVSAGMGKSLRAREAGFLTWAFSPEANYIRQTARNTKEHNKLMKEQMRILKNLQKALERIPQNPPGLVVSNFT